MTFPPPGATPYPYHPQQYPVVLAPSPQPPQLPAGYGCLAVDFNRGPYLVPATTTTRFKIGGVQPTTKPTPGRWFYPVLAGTHPVKLTDMFGIPMITTEVTVQPGGSHYLRFHFGGWRNRVYDGAGTDVTRFGMWSNYLIMLIVFGAIALCCGGLVALGALAS